VHFLLKRKDILLEEMAKMRKMNSNTPKETTALKQRAPHIT
jgi:hypothetical protein